MKMLLKQILGLLLIALMLGGVVVGLAGCAKKSDHEAALPQLQQVLKRGKLVAGVKYDSRPFGYVTPSGELQGFDIDLMHHIAERLLGDADAIEFRQVLSSTRIIALDTGTVDVVAATMTITPARESVIDFSRTYFKAGQAVVVPQNSNIHTVEDLKGKQVLYVLGSTSEGNLKDRTKAVKPPPTLTGFKTTTDAFSALKAGRGDAFTTDDSILAGLVGTTCDFRVLPQRLSEEPYGLGFKQDNRHHSTDTLREKVNEIIAELEAEGILQKLKEKWLEELDDSRCSHP